MAEGTVSIEICELRHAELERRLNAQHDAVMNVLHTIETRSEGIDRRLYKDNGSKSVLTIQREHDAAISNLTQSINKISRVMVFIISVAGAGILSASGYLVWAVIKSLVAQGKI